MDSYSSALETYLAEDYLRQLNEPTNLKSDAVTYAARCRNPMLAAAGVAVASSSAELLSYLSCAAPQGTMVGGLKSVTGHPQSAHVGDPLYGLGSLYSGAASQYSNGDLPPLQLGRFEARHLDASTSQPSRLRRDGIRADGAEHLPLWQRRSSDAVPPPTPTWLAVPPHHARFDFGA
jgi:hypothetical protein